MTGSDHVTRVVVIGNGMVGHRFIERLTDAERDRARFQVVAFCEEPRLAYDRVHLTDFFSTGADSLGLVEPGFYESRGVEVHVGDRAVAIDREARVVVSQSGRRIPYDRVVLATGSRPFVPPIEGVEGDGRFVYRTIEDLEAIQAYAAGCKRGVVLGGGLLGLEAANALHTMGLETHVVEFAPRLMAVQVDEGGGAILRRLIEGLGVGVHTSKNTVKIERTGAGIRMGFIDGGELHTDMIVYSAGIRPRDELAREAELVVGPRGGISIDDFCRTSDPDVFAIGECALWNERIYGLVAPGYAMAQTAADFVRGDLETPFRGADMSTKLKLMGVDVASFGDAHARTEGARCYAFTDEVDGIYKKLVVSEDGTRLLGGVLVGDASDYGGLLQVVQNDLALPPNPADLIVPARDGSGPALGGPETLPDSAQICSCNDVSKGALCEAVRGGATNIGALKACTNAGTGCGGCVPIVGQLLKAELTAQGIAVDDSLCEHFRHSRQDLYALVRLEGIRTFDDLIARHGTGRGCEICKPAVTSILAACWNEHVLAPAHAPLQDTNDRFLANIQRDGTYSVVPRVPGGEITPDKLIAIGTIAKQYDLYTKITGGQRIDLFGAQLHELPEIWRALIDAGFESGHAYGKALRTVKTCVGSTWCRYGVQDSVGLGIRLENRYKGLRAPHKLKMAVSGCIRECAEAQGKDVGVIATEAGYNLYVCGNGGSKPRHADLFATNLDEETLVRTIDRFLMFYIRTADKLQRTARWLENLDGGLDYVKEVVLDDRLGICAELEAEMAHIISTYQCEWKAAIEDDAIARRFRTFVNADTQGDAELGYVRERGQRRPVYPHENGATALRVVAR